MKKLYVFILCVFFTLGIYAQSAMSSEELAFRNQIERFLKEEGFVPIVDTDDNSLNFKKEGERYWLTVNGPEPFYVELHKSGFTLEDTNRNAILEACSHANATKRCGKAYATKSSVSFTVEFYCPSIDTFRKVFYKSMSAVDSTKDTMKEYYNEHK